MSLHFFRTQEETVCYFGCFQHSEKELFRATSEDQMVSLDCEKYLSYSLSRKCALVQVWCHLGWGCKLYVVVEGSRTYSGRQISVASYNLLTIGQPTIFTLTLKSATSRTAEGQ
jgi:hypothetical protein